jgi:hypothetical protein
VSELIEHAVNMGGGTDWSTRLEAAKILAPHVSPDSISKFSARDLKRLSEYCVARLADTNAMVLAANAEILHSFILQCSEEVSSKWIRDCTSGLINRLAGDLASTPREKLKNAITALQNTIAPDLQLELCFQALSKKKQCVYYFYPSLSLSRSLSLSLPLSLMWRQWGHSDSP